MASYTITTEGLNIVITNTSLTYDVIVDIFKKTCSSVQWKEHINITIPPNDSYTFDSLVDGFYKLEITHTEVNTTSLEFEFIEVTDTKLIKNFYISIENFVEDLEVILCNLSNNNSCKPCEEKYDSCKAILSAYSKIESFKRLMHPYLTPFLNQVYAYTNCFSQEFLDCQIGTEIVNGKYQLLERQFKKMLALDYIAIYLFYQSAEDNEYIPEFSVIKELLKFDTIMCCIEKNLGITLNEFTSSLAEFIINVEVPINLPPDVVGNNEETVFSVSGNNGNTSFDPPLIFTKEMFTTLTVPPYNDPEGDEAYKLRIDSLPSSGLLELNSVAVQQGDEILFSDIELGLFTYTPDTNLEQDHQVKFNFSVSDTGSEQYTS